MGSTLNSSIKPAADRPRLAFLDVARCVAALLVFVEHAIDMLVYHYQGSGPHVGVLGKIGVVLFFIISGFIIPQSLQEGGSNLRFWIRRFFRLYPAYWLTVGVTAVYVHVKDLDLYQPSDFLINLTMLQGFFSCPHVLGVFWTLHLELIFYIACSCLHAMGLLRDHAVFVMSWAIACCAVGAAAIIMLGERNFPVSSMRLVLMGTIVGLSAQMYCSGRFSLRGLTLIAGGLLASLLVIWSAGRLQVPDEATPALLGETAIVWVSAYLCFFTLLSIRHLRMPPPLTYLGRISYSIYLLHIFTISIFKLWPEPMWLRVLASVAASFAVSAASYHLIEKPGIRLGRWVERLLLRPSGRAAATNAFAPAPAGLPSGDTAAAELIPHDAAP
jgi:peptidoglycan/LPS O-acetylase OafA/YrhL